MPFLIMFSMLLVVFVTAYAGSSPSTPNVQNTVNGILANWPTVSIDNNKCSFDSSGLHGTCPGDLLTGPTMNTFLLGALWVLASIGSFFYRIALVGVLLSQIASIFGQFTTIPYIGPVFIAFIAIFALYAWSQLRASHHGM